MNETLESIVVDHHRRYYRAHRDHEEQCVDHVEEVSRFLHYDTCDGIESGKRRKEEDYARKALYLCVTGSDGSTAVTAFTFEEEPAEKRYEILCRKGVTASHAVGSSL